MRVSFLAQVHARTFITGRGNLPTSTWGGLPPPLRLPKSGAGERVLVSPAGNTDATAYAPLGRGRVGAQPDERDGQKPVAAGCPSERLQLPGRPEPSNGGVLTPLRFPFPQLTAARRGGPRRDLLLPSHGTDGKAKPPSSPFAHVGAGHTRIPRACASVQETHGPGSETPPSAMSLAAVVSVIWAPARVFVSYCTRYPTPYPPWQRASVPCQLRSLAATVTPGRSEGPSNLVAAQGVEQPRCRCSRDRRPLRPRRYLPPGPLGWRGFQRGDWLTVGRATCRPITLCRASRWPRDAQCPGCWDFPQSYCCVLRNASRWKGPVPTTRSPVSPYTCRLSSPTERIAAQ